MLGGGDLEQLSSHGNIGGDVESARGDLRYGTLQVARRRLHRHQIRYDLRRVLNDLMRAFRRVGEHRAQRFVPIDDVHDRDLQCRHVQYTRQPQRDRQVVRRRLGVEPVEEPHALLRERQRNTFGANAPGQRDARAPAGFLLDPDRQLSHRGRFEDRAHRHLGVESGPQSSDHLRGNQRVTAEFEEVVVEADHGCTEDVRRTRSRPSPRWAWSEPGTGGS